MKQYLDLLQTVLTANQDKIREDRTGVGTLSVFGAMSRYELSEGFPAVTTKKLAWKSVVSELLWFLEGGNPDERRLAELLYGKPREELIGKNTIWTANADNQGVALGLKNTETIKELGPVYPEQWRNFSGDRFNGVDQIRNAISMIKNDPNSRRIIVTAWNPLVLDRVALPSCHTGFQFYVKDGKLSCLFNQRSADSLLGIPFNVASYALLTHIVARECDLDVGELIHVMGDVHIYKNHVDQVKEQLTRKPYKLPKLKISDKFSLEDVLNGKTPLDCVNNFELVNYKHHPEIKAPMAV